MPNKKYVAWFVAIMVALVVLSWAVAVPVALSKTTYRWPADQRFAYVSKWSKWATKQHYQYPTLWAECMQKGIQRIYPSIMAYYRDPVDRFSETEAADRCFLLYS